MSTRFFPQQINYVDELNAMDDEISQLDSNSDLTSAEVVAARDGKATLLAQIDELQAYIGALQVWAEGASDFSQSNKVAVDGLDINSLSATLSSSTDIVGVFIYDTRRDSDSGMWRQRCAHTSWENETLSTATRGSKAKFPAIAAIIAEEDRVVIYDLTEKDFPMWMVFESGGSSSSNYDMVGPANGVSCVTAVNGVIYVGLDAAATHPGVSEIRLIADKGNFRRAHSSGVYQKYVGGIVDRNAGNGTVNVETNGSLCILNGFVHSIAAMVMDDAPTDPVSGLPIPMVAVATVDGVSIIRHNGIVVDITETTGTDDVTEHVALKASGELVFAHQRTTSPEYGQMVVCDIPTADWSANYYANLSGNNVRKYSYQTTVPQFGPDSTDTEIVAVAAGKDIYVGIDSPVDGLRVILESPGAGEGAIAIVNSSWATPYQVGDAELCLTGSDLTDRSKEETSVSGSATYAAVATGSSLQASTASGALTASVTTGGECYGWEQVSGSWNFRRSISEFAGVSESGGTLTIALNTIFTRLVYTNDTPTSAQLDAIEAADQPLFAASSDHLLDGTSDVILGLGHDPVSDQISVITSWGRSTFQGLSLVSSEATSVGTPSATAIMDGAMLQAGATGVKGIIPVKTLRGGLVRASEPVSPALPPVRQFDQSSGVSDTLFWADAGWKPVAVFWSASGNLTLVPKDDYTVVKNDSQIGVEFDSAPGSGTVGILAARTG